MTMSTSVSQSILSAMYLEEHHKNLQITTSERTCIMAHSAVLAAVSQVFNRIFHKSTFGIFKLRTPGVSTSEWNAILQFIYKGIPHNLKYPDPNKLLNICKSLEMPILEEHLKKYMQQTDENATGKGGNCLKASDGEKTSKTGLKCRVLLNKRRGTTDSEAQVSSTCSANEENDVMVVIDSESDEDPMCNRTDMSQSENVNNKCDFTMLPTALDENKGAAKTFSMKRSRDQMPIHTEPNLFQSQTNANMGKSNIQPICLDQSPFKEEVKDEPSDYYDQTTNLQSKDNSAMGIVPKEEETSNCFSDSDILGMLVGNKNVSMNGNSEYVPQTMLVNCYVNSINIQNGKHQAQTDSSNGCIANNAESPRCKQARYSKQTEPAPSTNFGLPTSISNETISGTISVFTRSGKWQKMTRSEVKKNSEEKNVEQTKMMTTVASVKHAPHSHNFPPGYDFGGNATGTGNCQYQCSPNKPSNQNDMPEDIEQNKTDSLRCNYCKKWIMKASFLEHFNVCFDAKKDEQLNDGKSHRKACKKAKK